MLILTPANLDQLFPLVACQLPIDVLRYTTGRGSGGIKD